MLPLDREPVTAPVAPQHLSPLQQHQPLDQMAKVLSLVPVEKPDQEAIRLLAELLSQQSLALDQQKNQYLTLFHLPAEVRRDQKNQQAAL